MRSSVSLSGRDCVVTAFGAVTAQAIGRKALWSLLERSERPAALGMPEFKAAARFVDRKYLRATSTCDAVALASLTTMIEARGADAVRYADERIGIYVGAAPASAHGNEPYIEAMLACRDAGGMSSIREFGKTCMTSRPTTLLMGLPNNVLCYGSMMLGARGSNSNYTVPWLGGILAITNAARRLRRGSLDLAVAGAYSAYGTDLGRALYRQLAAAHDLPDFSESIADGAAFVALERRAALAPSDGLTTLLGAGVASDGLGPMCHDPKGLAFERLLRQVIADAGLEARDVGLVLVGQTGMGRLDALERSVLARLFAEAPALPAVASLHPVLGNLMEARAVIELGLVADFFAAGAIPAAVQVSGWPIKVDASRRVALIMQASPWGEYGCLVVRGDG